MTSTPSVSVASELRLDRDQYRAIVAHCYDGLPDEACGLLAGPRAPEPPYVPFGPVTSVHPCANAAKSSKRYRIDSLEYDRIDRALAPGQGLVGVWHSHTHTDAYPSPTDVEEAMGLQSLNGTWFFPIVSLKHGEPVVRAYRIDAVDGAIAEIPVVVTD